MSTTTEGRAPEAAPAPEKRGLVDWLVQRLGLTATMEDQYNRIVPKHATNYIYCFGGIAFVLFIILAVTGILLAVYYQPTPDTAYQSVLNISTHVQFGWWIRSIHRWSAGGMVLLVFIHTLRVFFTGAYKAPRELNWLTGVPLFLITLGFGFTGLPAAVGPEGVLGDQGRHRHRRLGAVHRPLPARDACAAASRSAPPRSAGSSTCTSSCCRPSSWRSCWGTSG